MQQQLQQFYDRKWCEQYTGSDGGVESARLFMEPLLQDIVDRMSVQADQRVRFAMYTGRDLVVGPVAAALGFFNCVWPPFGSHVVFELYAQRGYSVPVAVRVLFDGIPVTSKLHGCASTGVCPKIC